MVPENILMAIDLATDPGGCDYDTCIIGKLAEIEGTEVRFKFGVTVDAYEEYFPAYPMNCLYMMQSFWDSSGMKPLEQVREEARKYAAKLDWGLKV